MGEKMSPKEIKNFWRTNLHELFRDSGFTVGAEIGVYRGHHAKEMCLCIPNLKLYCVDLWTAYQPTDIAPYISQERQDSNFKRSIRNLRGYNVVFMKQTSMDAVKTFPNESLDFVYIDANHDYEHAMQDITEWEKKVRVGGIISGHDYDPDWGVKKAVDTYVMEHKINNCFYTVCHSPSFWWVK